MRTRTWITSIASLMALGVMVPTIADASPPASIAPPAAAVPAQLAPVKTIVDAHNGDVLGILRDGRPVRQLNGTWKQYRGIDKASALAAVSKDDLYVIDADTGWIQHYDHGTRRAIRNS